MDPSGSDTFFRLLIEEAPIAIIAVDVEGRITYTNRMLLEMLEYTSEELVGHKIELLLPQRLQSVHENHRQNYVADPQRRSMGVGRDLLAVSKSGREIPVEIGLHPFQTPEGLRVAAVVVDITERIHQQEINARHDRLEAVGFLAGGLAHDYNNVLAGILGNADLLEKTVPLKAKDQLRLEAVRKLVAKGSIIANRLITFSKGGAPVFSVENLAEVVRDAAETSLSGTNSSVDYRFSGNPLFSRVDKNQFSQVVTNLMINAVQAMPSGGHIRISGELLDVRDEDHGRPVKPGRYVHLTFQDNGPGIPQEIQSKLFDPFFTTKAQGNGLGLAIVHSVVEQHGGLIRLESELGRGASFHILLPAASAENGLEEEMDLGINPELVCSDTGKILVMDDNEFVRDAVASVLRTCGYEVIECGSGTEALDLLRQAALEDKPFSLLVLDVMIPGQMGGIEVARIVRTQSKSIPIVLMSGYTEERLEHLERRGIDDYLHKPFKMIELLTIVERLLNGQDKGRPR
jgi:PAS domain S-box-containing protein